MHDTSAHYSASSSSSSALTTVTTVPPLLSHPQTDVLAAAKAKRAADPSSWNPSVAQHFRKVLQAFPPSGEVVDTAPPAGTLVIALKPQVRHPKLARVLGVVSAKEGKALGVGTGCVRVQMLCDAEAVVALDASGVQRIAGLEAVGGAAQAVGEAGFAEDIEKVMELGNQQTDDPETMNVVLLVMCNLARKDEHEVCVCVCE